jgi:hypothetical protein
MSKASEGELKNRIWTQMPNIILAITKLAQNQDSEKESNLEKDLKREANELNIILDEAKKDLISKLHENCYWHQEGSCDGPDWRIYHNQPEDCPLRYLEKWFGETDEHK